MRVFWTILSFIMLIGSAPASAETLRLAVLKFGTVNWELDTIRHNGLDKAAGFELDVLGMAGGPASMIAFQGGEVDMFVSNWIWVARQRAAGLDYVFIPYSKAVGGMVVPADSPVHELSDLKGAKIGIAGGPLDKSWLVLQAYAQRQGFDLAGQTEQVFGAPPLIFQQALRGDVQGAINFWHFLAKMKAKGFREVISVADAARALGLDPETPMLGYVVKGEFLRAHPDLVAGFAAASRAAKRILATDDAEWDRLRPRMKAGDDATFAALKAGFRAGIPATSPIDENAASAFLALMGELGGEKLVGKATSLPDGIFYTGN